MAVNHNAVLRPFACCVAALFLLTGCHSRSESEQAFRHLEKSPYLQNLWAETCSFPLTAENIILLAFVGREADASQLRCDWHRIPIGTSESGVSFVEGVTDLDARWFNCGGSTSLADLVWDAVQHPGSNLVHLGKGLPSDAQKGVVLVAKCHYWDDHYCTIKSGNLNCDFHNADEIMSMAYAVLYPETGEILW